MYCPKCGIKNEAGSNYCKKCGLFLEKISFELKKENTSSAPADKNNWLNEKDDNKIHKKGKAPNLSKVNDNPIEFTSEKSDPFENNNDKNYSKIKKNFAYLVLAIISLAFLVITRDIVRAKFPQFSFILMGLAFAIVFITFFLIRNLFSRRR